MPRTKFVFDRDEIDPDGNLMFADGLDRAIIGVGDRCGQPAIVAYDVSKVIEILMTRDGMSYEEATEFFEFNISGAWMGELTPIWIHPLDQD